LETNDDHIFKATWFKLPVPVLLFYLSILIVLFAIAAFSYSSLKKPILKQKSLEISSIAELKVQQISDFRTGRIHEARFYQNNKTFIKTVQKFNKNSDPYLKSELNDWLKLLTSNHTFAEIMIFDAVTGKKTLDISDNPTDTSNNIDPNDLECLKSDSIVFGDLSMDKSENRIHLSVLLPLILRTGPSVEKIAVVKFVLDANERLYSLIQSMPNSGKTGEVLVVKRDGNDVLYVNELRFRKNTALKYRMPITTKNLPAARALLGDESVSEGVDYRGKKVLAIARLIPGTDWSLVVKFDTEEIFAEIKTLGFLIIGMLVLLISASGFGLTTLWSRKKIGYYKTRINDLYTINRLNHLYKLLIDIEQSISKNNSIEKLLNDSCRIISNEGSYSLCWIGIINSQSGYLQQIENCEFNQKYLATIKYFISKKLEETQDPAGKAIINGRFFVSNDIWNDPIMKGWRKKAIPGEFNSLAIFPLIQNAKTLGAIFFYSDKTDFFMKDEQSLLEQLTKDISYALDKIEIEKEEKNAKERLLRHEQELNAQNEQLAIAREKAEQSERLKSAFLANMSHEIRTPMNALLGFSDLLMEANVTEETRQYCQIISSQSNYLLHLISDILDISKIDSHTVTIHPEIISLNKFLDELHLIYLNKLKTSNKAIKLICKKPKGTKQFDFSTDILKFRQIFTNLLDNAIKFTESGDVSFGYHIHNNEELVCFVSDTGIGIDMKYQKEIFEIFRQAQNNSKKNYGGTGLGLAICKGNAKVLGGDIWVESKPDKGSVFYFSVSYSQNGDSNLKSIDELTSPKTMIPAYPSKQWKTKEILLVEDDLCTIEYLKIIFSQIGLKLKVAHNGKETEEYYKKLHEIDIVLLDMNLPDANGFDIVKQLKKIRSDIPIIAQTALTIEDNGKEFLKAGCDGYLAKPYKRKQVLNMINSFLTHDTFSPSSL
jgi:signal transduction histidine kinase/CheY-like chemotaxis protein